jgi:hypothetical protein
VNYTSFECRRSLGKREDNIKVQSRQLSLVILWHWCVEGGKEDCGRSSYSWLLPLIVVDVFGRSGDGGNAQAGSPGEGLWGGSLVAVLEAPFPPTP